MWSCIFPSSIFHPIRLVLKSQSCILRLLFFFGPPFFGPPFSVVNFPSTHKIRDRTNLGVTCAIITKAIARMDNSGRTGQKRNWKKRAYTTTANMTVQIKTKIIVYLIASNVQPDLASSRPNCADMLAVRAYDIGIRLPLWRSRRTLANGQLISIYVIRLHGKTAILLVTNKCSVTQE